MLYARRLSLLNEILFKNFMHDIITAWLVFLVKLHPKLFKYAGSRLDHTVMSKVSVSSFQLCQQASLTIPHYNYYLAQ